jgi:phage repressor protein C with HTH and peptisase S24 domain
MATEPAPILLKKLRARAGLSMRELAHACGYRDASGIQRYEDPHHFHRDHLPLALVRSLISVLVGRGEPPITLQDVAALAGPGVILEPVAAEGAKTGPVPPVREAASYAARQRREAQALERDLPVYASAQGGPTGMMVTSEPIEYVYRPDPLMGVPRAFAVYVVGDSMSPAYEHGDLILVHPHSPPRRGDDVLLAQAEFNGEVAALVKRLVGWNEKSWHVRQFNPRKDYDLSRAEWQQVRVVIGKYNRR